MQIPSQVLDKEHLGDIPGDENLRQLIIDATARVKNAILNGDKDIIREVHIEAKMQFAEINPSSMLSMLPKFRSNFLSGSEIIPEKISPILIEVKPRSKEEILFKLCRTYWSMPYSKGYGRRLRFIVYDQYHKAVIGIIGLQSPPADLACRDKLIGCDKSQKLKFVNATMDAYTIGAIPPYSSLLGGKLVAGMVSTDKIRQAYWRKYAGKKSLMKKQLCSQPLIGITTTSAFGRSSIYNRLRFKSRILAEPIGYTKGFGLLHLEGVYPDIVKWLRGNDLFVGGGFGHGPKVRWQNISRAISKLGVSRASLQHGVKREVFLFRLVKNFENICCNDDTPQAWALRDETWSRYWLNRWAIPRSKRIDGWRYQSGYDAIENALKEMCELEDN